MEAVLTRFYTYCVLRSAARCVANTRGVWRTSYERGVKLLGLRSRKMDLVLRFRWVSLLFFLWLFLSTQR